MMFRGEEEESDDDDNDDECSKVVVVVTEAATTTCSDTSASLVNTWNEEKGHEDDDDSQQQQQQQQQLQTNDDDNAAAAAAAASSFEDIKHINVATRSDDHKLTHLQRNLQRRNHAIVRSLEQCCTRTYQRADKQIISLSKQFNYMQGIGQDISFHLRLLNHNLSLLDTEMDKLACINHLLKLN